MFAAEPIYNVTTEGMPDSTNNNAVHSLTEMISNVSQLLFLFVPIGTNRCYYSDDATWIVHFIISAYYVTEVCHMF